MTKLNELVNKYIFFDDENRDYENCPEDLLFLIQELELRGVLIVTSNQKTYFYARMEFEDIQVTSDSRNSKLIPKTINQAILISALQIFGENILSEEDLV